MILIQSNANAKQWNEGEERRFWVKDIRTRGKREAVGQKKKSKYWLLGAAPTAAQKFKRTNGLQTWINKIGSI